MKKEKVFSKFNTRSYNNKLEEILSYKPFSENVKNNILNMIYKIEEAYEDYETVKVEVQNKKEFLEKVLKSIEKHCELIQLLTTDEMKNEKYVIDYDNKNIKVLPNNKWLLYAILKILKENKNYEYEEDITERKPIYDFLNIGHDINNVEVIRDFNGWSWINSVDEIENVNVNLIYQNLQFLLGNNFMEEFINNINENDNFIEILKNELEKKYDKEIIQRMIEILRRISIVEISNIDKKYKDKLLELKKHKLEELSVMENKKEYLKGISLIKKENIEKIKSIDKIINDNELLKAEYKKRNSVLKNDEKIFSISYLTDILNEEREEALQKIADINVLMDPKNYVQKKEETKSIIGEISINDRRRTSSSDSIIEMQKLFINCVLTEINSFTEKTDIINMLYKIRYYINIVYNEKKYIKDVLQIKNDIKKIQEKLIEKLLEYKLVVKFSDDNEINKEILSNILNTKIINLQTIYIVLSKNGNEIKIEIHDEDELIKIEKLELDDVKKIDIKLGKKIKMFL